MKNLALRVMLLLCVLTLAIPALLAQNATQSDHSDQSKNEQKSPEYVYRTTTRLVILDIVATDSKGNIVTDLKPEEIQILDNGKEQTKVDFSFIHPNAEKSRDTSGNASSAGCLHECAAIQGQQLLQHHSL